MTCGIALSMVELDKAYLKLGHQATSWIMFTVKDENVSKFRSSLTSNNWQSDSIMRWYTLRLRHDWRPRIITSPSIIFGLWIALSQTLATRRTSHMLSLIITPIPIAYWSKKVTPSMFSLKSPCSRGLQQPASFSSLVEEVVQLMKRAWMESSYCSIFSNSHLFLFLQKLYAIRKKVVISSFLLCFCIYVTNSIKLLH